MKSKVITFSAEKYLVEGIGIYNKWNYLSQKIVTMKNTYLPALLALLFFASCKKTDDQKSTSEPSHTAQQNNFNNIAFAKTLAKSLVNKEIRNLLKQEALKMFDKDYDVLYGFSRDITGSTGKTLHEQIAAYAENKEQFNELAIQSPLLTIYIPQLENFDADKWDTDKQIPIVAVRNVDDKKNGRALFAYDASGNEIKLDYAVKPDRPVIVVKDNERVVAENGLQNSAARTNNANTFFKSGSANFSFIDDSYNGLKVSEPTQAQRQVPLSQIEPRVVTAFDKNIVPQRDYVYYGIDPTQGVDSGPFNSDYAEFITGIIINSSNSMNYIIDDFTDGMLEFQVNVFFVQNGGGVSSVLKVFPCDPNKLFEPTRIIGVPNGIATVDYTLPTPIQITDWDMQKYGDTWKFAVMEYDPGTQSTQTTTVTSTFGSNFSFDLPFGILKKIGLKFGGSATTTRTETTTFTVTGTSDNLGEALLDYSAPVMLSKITRGSLQGVIYGINTGTITLYIETKKRY